MRTMDTSARVVDGLRRWAAGSATDEAAVELLIGCLPARYAQLSCPWVRPCRRPGWYWLDPKALAALQLASPRQRHVLTVVVALLGGRPTDSICDGSVAVGRAAA